ncbi:MAG: CehA/McbA family metallohydrolase [Bryobacterales bacterium]|nr:CehA/McbA family metallohydrolase [Bryobacterales bacterium]
MLSTAGVLPAQRRVYPAARQGGNYMHNYYFPPAPGSTPWAPDWSPDGKWIAVGLHGSIWKIDPASGAAIQLTAAETYDSSPDWSPDGKWIAYIADEGHRRIQLRLLNVESGESRALTNDDQIYTDPVFSPDGKRLAYVSTRPKGNFNIYVRPISDGEWAGEEIALTRDNRYPRSRLYFGPWDLHISPAWTPNGKEILCVSNRNVQLGSGDVWRMPVEPDGISKAVVLLHEETLFRTRPDVSIDGKRFVYSSSGGTSDTFNHLYVLPVAGGTPYKLTFGDWDEFSPRWSPDGESIAYVSNQGGLPQLWVMETYGGGKRKITPTKLVWKRPVGQLHVRVLDETGSLTGARIQGHASDGKFYAPSDAYARIGQYGRHAFHTPGEFTLTLPPGKITLQATKGFEYEPAFMDADIRPNQTSQATVRLKRTIDLPARGWRSGSTHVHMNYGGNLRNTLENLMMMARAEGLNVVGEQIANKDNRVLDWQYFVPGGGAHPVSLSDPSVRVIVGQEYRPPFWGHTSFFGLRDHLISPFTTGYEGTGIESLYPSNTDMFRKARAQGAFISYVHAVDNDTDPLDGSLDVAKAFPVDAALGTVDAYEWSRANTMQLSVWHKVLNNDLPVVAVGGEDSISNLHFSKLIGSVRTYAYVGGNFTTETWFEALRKGRAYFTTGPLIDFEVNGEMPGGAIRLPAEGGTVKLKAAVRSIVPLTKVVVYSNGRVIHEVPANQAKSASFEREVAVTESSWFSLYAEGPPNGALDIGYPQAATNVVRVYVGNRRIRNRESAEYFMRWIDKLRSMADAWLWWRSQAEKDHVFAQLAEARKVYERLAEEAR